MREMITAGLLVIFLIIFVFWGIPRMTGKELVGHCSLREDHLALMELGLQNNHDLRVEATEINHKLDLLLNIATNTIDGVRVVR